MLIDPVLRLSADAKLLFILVLLGVFCPRDLQAQNPRRMLVAAHSTDFSTGMEKMAVLHNQLYVYGFSGGSMEVKYQTLVNLNGSHKLFITKYNDTGLYLRTMALGGYGSNLNGDASNLGKSLVCFSGVYSGGYSEGNVKVISGNGKGMFVTALDSSLKNIWRLFLKANDKFHCNFLCPDGKGNLFAAGFFSDTLVAGSKTFLSTRIFGQTDKTKDIFLLQISGSGTLLNAWTYGGHGNDYPTALTADRNGNAVLSVVVSDTVMLGDYEYKQQSKSRAVVFKTDIAGHTYWATAFSGAGAVVNGLDYNSKNEIVCGAHFRSSLFIKSKFKTTKLNTNGEYHQIAVLLLDTFGNLISYKTEGSANEVNLTALVLDPSDNIYVAGDYACTFTGLNSQNISWSFRNLGFGDIYLAAYTSKLTSLFQRHIGGTRADLANHLVYWNGKPVVCGSYQDNFQIACDSNVQINFSAYGNSIIFRDYYMGYSPGPHRLYVGFEQSWIHQQGGFFTDLVDIKGQLINPFQPTYASNPRYCENAMWEFEVENRQNIYCSGTYLRYFWLKDNYYGSNYLGVKLEYTLDNKPYTRNDLQNYRINATGFHSLVINSEDKCYRDTLEATTVIIPEESADIQYDKWKYPNRIVLCNNDSICLTAANTKGLKYLWIVQNASYYLDTGNRYDTTDKWRYGYSVRDTFYSPTICIHKKSVITLEVEENDKCLRGRSLFVEKDKMGPDDSLVWFLTDTSTNYCRGQNSAYTYFNIRVLDKKSGIYRYPDLFVTIKINGKSYATSQQNQFYIPIPDTGQIKISGTAQIGCETYNFALNKKVVLKKPTIKINGELSNCHTTDRIFTVDSGFLTYQWNVNGLPDTPKITQITPWKIRVQGSTQQISVFAYADTNKGKECYVSQYKYVSTGARVTIKSSVQPAQLCPGSKITLTADDAQSYAWFPTGETTKSITVDEPGIYYCRVKDTGDCEYNTNDIQVEGYYDPDILIEPDDGVCFGDDADIFVIAPNAASVKWTTPTSWGASRHITTKQLGIFYCEVKYCNTTYKLKAQIVSKMVDTHSLRWNYQICSGQKIKLSSHDSETYAYQWLPGKTSGRYFIADKAGTFIVQARDLCDDWYNSDVYIISPSAAVGTSGELDTLVCGWKNTTINLREKYSNIIDTSYTCLWQDNGDTAFLRTFLPGKANYTALIKNKFCTAEDTFKVRINNHITPGLKIQPGQQVCKGDTFLLTAVLTDTAADKFRILWNNNLGSGPMKYRKATGPEWLKVSYKDTCGTAKDSIWVNPLVVQAAYDIAYYVADDEVILTDRSKGTNMIRYSWYVDGKWFGNGKVLQMPSPLYPNSVACLEVENAAGCKDSVCKVLPMYNEGKFYVPSAFHPGSSISGNNRFAPVSKKYTEYDMLIFNRWGEKLFEGDNNSNGWDGRYMGALCPSGHYVYIIHVKYKYIYGEPRTETYKGTVFLLE